MLWTVPLRVGDFGQRSRPAVGRVDPRGQRGRDSRGLGVRPAGIAGRQQVRRPGPLVERAGSNAPGRTRRPVPWQPGRGSGRGRCRAAWRGRRASPGDKLACSSLHRCLERHAIPRRPDDPDKACGRDRFADTAIGTVPIGIGELRLAEGKPNMLPALDRASKSVAAWTSPHIDHGTLLREDVPA